MSNLKCSGCQQTFDNKKLLFDHLQKNASHKRGKKASKNTSSKSLPQPQKPSHGPSKSHVLVSSENASTQACPTSLEQHSANRQSWLCVTAEQNSYLRQVIPSKCHSLQTLQSSQYHLYNRTCAQLEQLQTCLNCNSKLQDRPK